MLLTLTLLYGAWQFALQRLSLLHVDMAQKSMLDTAQRIFKHGNKNGRMLVWLAKGQFATTHLSGVRDQDGGLLRSPVDINNRFCSYYR